MTEDEAKTKWCPHKRVVIVSDDLSDLCPSHNLIAFDGKPDLAKDAPHYRCIGSACMAWRFNISMATGFCGLAGRP